MALSNIVNNIFASLDILVALDSHQTLLVNGDRLAVDSRYFQSFCRAWTRDSRDSILHSINRTLLHWDEVLQAYANTIRLHTNQKTPELSDMLMDVYDYLVRMQSRRDKVIQGLTRLTTFQRYAHDTAFKIDVQCFIDKIQKLVRKCDFLIAEMVKFFPDIGAGAVVMENVKEI